MAQNTQLGTLYLVKNGKYGRFLHNLKNIQIIVKILWPLHVLNEISKSQFQEMPYKQPLILDAYTFHSSHVTLLFQTKADCTYLWAPEKLQYFTELSHLFFQTFSNCTFSFFQPLKTCIIEKAAIIKVILSAASSLDIRHNVIHLWNAKSIHLVAIYGNMKQFSYCSMRVFKNHKAT